MNFKKITSFSAALVLSVGMATGSLGSSVQTISARDYRHVGDVNVDGKINSTDIILVAAHIKGLKILKGNAYRYADVNCDGIVSVKDLNLIAAHVKGKALLIPDEEEPEDEITGGDEDTWDEDLA